MAKGRRTNIRRMERDSKEAPKAYPDQADKSRRSNESIETNTKEIDKPRYDQNP